jgi:hypothetical protein
MKVLIACEYSGRVRDAFRAAGHDAMSCDLLPTEVDGPHHQGCVFDVIDDGWDLMIAHPPCTMLTRAGARWWKGREQEQDEALEFVQKLMAASIPKIAIENPPGAIGTRIRKADQYIQPWEHGHTEKKMTGLWLKNLLPLQSSRIVFDDMMKLPEKERSKCHYAAPGPDRWKERSRTYEGIARAMAAQWG